ncbi:hypothetical protein [Streptomyces sp. NPDC058751]|uniref:hypothetical protein n=1 Tax=Streptomyces sp. NPDC058751 TaxID=3346623 RepID=UPI0036D04A9A
MVAAGVDGCYLTVAPLYLLKVAGLRASEAGFSFSAAAVEGMRWPFWSDERQREGRIHNLLPWVYVGRGVCFFCFPLMGSPVTALVIKGIAATAESAKSLIRADRIVESAGMGRHRCTAQMCTVQNVSFSAVGLLVIPVLIAEGRSGYTEVTVVKALFFFIALLFIARVWPSSQDRAHAGSRQTEKRFWAALRDRRVLVSMTADAVVCLHSSVLLYLLPVWITTEPELPKGHHLRGLRGERRGYWAFQTRMTKSRPQQTRPDRGCLAAELLMHVGDSGIPAGGGCRARFSLPQTCSY